MPLISTIGHRSLRTRLVFASIYAILLLGSVTMIYPLLLMLSGSVKSQADFYRPTPFPEYLYDDSVLWQKYIESKYITIPDGEIALGRPIGSWSLVTTPKITQPQLVKDFQEFRDHYDWPVEWYFLGHTSSEVTSGKNNLVGWNTRVFRAFAQKRFHNNLDAYCNAIGVHYPAWSYVGAPLTHFTERQFDFPQSAAFKLYYELKARLSRKDWAVTNLDGAFRSDYLRPDWGDVKSYNKDHHTHFKDYRQVLLREHPPAAGPARDDWEKYVRTQLNLAFIRLDPKVTDSFRDFLKMRYERIGELNHLWQTHYSGFASIPLFNTETRLPPRSPRATVHFSTNFPTTLAALSALSDFIKNAKLCPTDALSVFGPRQAFERFLADKYHAKVHPAPLPIEQVDYADFQTQKGLLRWNFIKENYLTVWDYLAGHGNGIRNTIIFCTLMILTNLIVNPLAAYSLSRYQPPSTYKILLFCMCTMAFPAEVTMIPAFLLLKRFPVFNLLIATVATIVVMWLALRLYPHLRDLPKFVLAGTTFIIALVVPSLWHINVPSVSLLNTFWALILPGMANGYFIFLLKGFFDSLPRELYEAADIDGAGEWTKFWTLTMNLSKPILAVLALNAFTAAYSEFMMALVIIPDPKMWTMMVWLYQLQTISHPAVVYASLVIAAIPTLMIFLVAQNLIIRGIVVPVEK